MKILILSHFFPPTHNAGAEKRALGYALALRAAGHNVQVACAGDWEKGPRHWNGFRDEAYQGIPVRRAHLNWTAAPDPNGALYDNPDAAAHLDAWLGEWKPDVAHIISLVTLSGSAVEVLKRHGIPVVFTLTDFWLICPKISLVRGDGSLCDGQTTAWDCLKCLMWDTRLYRGLRGALPEAALAAGLSRVSRQPGLTRVRGLRGFALDMDERKRKMAELSERIDYFTAPSHALARVIEESGVTRKPVRVIHSGHDLDWARDLPDKTPSARLRFGYIGQIIPVKGLHLLIEAFQGVDAARAELVIYGDAQHDPAYTAQLKARIRPGDAITFRGAFPHEQLGDVFSQIDALLVPSQWHENNPRVIQEAFAARTPVIASDVSGIAEFVEHGANGLLFRHDSAADLSRQMVRVIAEPGLVQQLVRGIQPVKTIQEEIQEYMEIYRELTASSRPEETAALTGGRGTRG